MRRAVRTPGSVITAAVFMFVYGGLMLVCSACSGISLLQDDEGVREALAKEVPGYLAVEVGLAVWNLVIGAVMILLGIGVLMLAPSARRGAFVAATAEILLMFVVIAFQAFMVIPAQGKFFEEQRNNMPPGQAPIDAATMTQQITWAVLILSSCLTLVTCTSIMFLLSTRKARKAFAGEIDQAFADEDWPDDDWSDDDY